jgi:hypothetical protein
MRLCCRAAQLLVLALTLIISSVLCLEEQTSAVDSSAGDQTSWFKPNRNLGCSKLKKPRVLCATTIGAKPQAIDNLVNNLKASGSQVSLRTRKCLPLASAASSALLSGSTALVQIQTRILSFIAISTADLQHRFEHVRLEAKIVLFRYK